MGKQIASLSQRPTSWLLRLRLQQCRIVMSLSVSVDGRRAVSVGNDSNPFRGGDGRVWVWVRDLEAGKRLHTLTGDVGSTGAVAVSADGRHAVSGGKDGAVRVWDLDAGKLLHTLTGHDGRVPPVGVSADGRRAISGGHDGTVRVWDLMQGAELASFVSGNSITAVAVTPTGARVAVGTSAGPVHLLELCGYE